MMESCQRTKQLLETLILEETKESESTINLLIKQGVTISAEGLTNYELLLNAISKNYLDVVKMLLKIGIDIDEVYPTPTWYRHGNFGGYDHLQYAEFSLLHAAAWRSTGSMVQLLIDHGANLNLKCREGRSEVTPLAVAVSRSNLEIVQLLLQNGAAVKRNEISKASIRDVEIMRTLLQSAVGMSVEIIDSVFYRALFLDNPDPEMIKVLVSFGAVVRSDAISRALVVGDAKLMEVLLQNTVISAEMMRTALLDVAAKGKLEVMKALLLNANFTVEMINSAFLHAVSHGNLEAMKLLLRSGASIDAVSPHDESHALHLVSDNKSGCEIIKFLIVNNVNLEVQDEQGRTPLFRAAERGLCTVVELLSIFGARIDVVDEDGRSAFLDVVMPEALLESTEYINVQLHPFKALLDAYFQDPGFIVKTNTWKIFNASYLKRSPDLLGMYRCHEDVFKEFSKIFERHLIKIKAANLEFNDELVVLSWHSPKPKKFLRDCAAEIRRMKTVKIGISDVTLYDILIKDANQLASYARNNTIYQVFKFNDFRTKFPIYADIIDFQIKKGIMRRELLDEGLKICQHLFSMFLSLPLELREQIVNHQTNQSLAVLKYAFTGSVHHPHKDQCLNAGSNHAKICTNEQVKKEE